MRTLALALAVAYFGPTDALPQGNAMTAKDLLQVCTTAEVHWVDFCNGYFQALHDAAEVAGRVCTPSGTTRTQLVETYQAYAELVIEKNPSVGGLAGASLGMDILGSAFPCQ